MRSLNLDQYTLVRCDDSPHLLQPRAGESVRLDREDRRALHQAALAGVLDWSGYLLLSLGVWCFSQRPKVSWYEAVSLTITGHVPGAVALPMGLRGGHRIRWYVVLDPERVKSSGLLAAIRYAGWHAAPNMPEVDAERRVIGPLPGTEGQGR